MPRLFWHLSLVGSLISLSYFIHIKNPVLILTFSQSALIYFRNIHLNYLNARKEAAAIAGR
jgi:lipid-A-disaccharide synthase-like uncharacterized protein